MLGGCSECRRPMRGSTVKAGAAPGTVKYGGRGRCHGCYSRLRKTGDFVPHPRREPVFVKPQPHRPAGVALDGYLAGRRRRQARQIARARYDEALRVQLAYEGQVAKRRAAWKAAAGDEDNRRAAANLAAAVAQLEKAGQDADAAWKAWHALV